MFYDPMIAKLITWGETRDEAADLQVQALDDFRIVGLRHNLDFLSALVQHPRFRSGDLTTAFIAEEYPDGFTGAPASEEMLRGIAVIAAEMEAGQESRANSVSGRIDGPPPVSTSWVVRIGRTDFHVTPGDGHALVDGHVARFSCDWLPGMRSARADIAGRKLGLQIAREHNNWSITTHGARHVARVLPARLAPLAAHMIEKPPADLSKLLMAPMAGLLISLRVAEGDEVEIGQPLGMMEAMKMEILLRAEKSGRVAAINVKEGDSLAAETVILELE